MNINVRLQEIERVLHHIRNDVEFQPHEFLIDDLAVDWLISTIKQQQQRIAELEKERREITAAHEAFLKELEEAIIIMKHNELSRATLEEVEQSYNKFFQSESTRDE